MAANMLEGADQEKLKGRSLSEGDVMFALASGPIFLRINSIELGLKHILDNEMGRPVPKKHDLVILACPRLMVHRLSQNDIAPGFTVTYSARRTPSLTASP